jgi:DNA polymerase III delta' subunit
MSFADFPTQAGVVQLLQRSLDRGRLAHAYLFSGHDSDELEGAAATLAKVLNCANPVRSKTGAAIDSCDQCDSCKRIDSFNHPDVQWIRAESKLRIISIDQIRELLQTVNLKPTLGGYKVGVITAADRLNQQAANAFLKTLEEPPERTIFILLTTDISRILETILSRCLRLNFAGDHAVKLAPDEDQWLSGFASQVAAERPGLFRRYKLLDSVLGRLSFLKEQVDDTLTKASPLTRSDTKEVEPGLRKRWEDELDASIEAEYRRKRTEALAILHWWLRDVWLLTAHNSDQYLTFPSLGAASQKVAARLKETDAMENLDLIDRTQQILHTNAQEALTLEVSFLRLKL